MTTFTLLAMTLFILAVLMFILAAAYKKTTYLIPGSVFMASSVANAVQGLSYQA